MERAKKLIAQQETREEAQQAFVNVIRDRVKEVEVMHDTAAKLWKRGSREITSSDVDKLAGVVLELEAELRVQEAKLQEIKSEDLQQAVVAAEKDLTTARHLLLRAQEALPQESAQPAVPARLGLRVPDSPVRIKLGEKASIDLRVERENCAGAVQVQLHDLPAGLTAEPATIPDSQTAAKTELVANDNATPTSARHVRVEARLGMLKDEKGLIVVVEPKPSLKALEGEDAPAIKELLAKARERAQTLPQAWDKTSTLCSIAVALARAGEKTEARKIFEDARHVTEAVEASTELTVKRGYRLGTIAQAQARAGFFNDSLDTARSIPRDEPQALIYVGAALAKAGDKKTAGKTFDEAREATAGVSNAASRAWTYASVADAQGEAGLLADAIKTAELIPDGDASKARVLAKIAVWLAKQRERAEAGRAFHEAEQSAALVDPRFKEAQLTEIAEALTEAGFHVRAQAVAEKIQRPDLKARLLCQQALQSARAGDKAEARKILGRARTLREGAADLDDKAQGLSRTAQTQADIGFLSEARQSVDRIPFERYWYRITPLERITSALARAGFYHDAHQTVEAIPFDSEHSKAAALLEIVRAQVNEGLFKEALEMTGLIPAAGAWIKIQALREIAKAQARRNDKSSARATFTSAVRAARLTQDSGALTGNIQLIAWDMVQAGLHSEILKLAETEQDSYVASGIYLGVAEGFLQAKGLWPEEDAIPQAAEPIPPPREEK